METSAAVEQFHEDGYVVFRNAFAESDINSLHTAGMRNFEEVQEIIASRELELGIGVKNCFKEIVQRHKDRYEMPYKMDEQEFKIVLENEELMSLIKGILGEPIAEAEVGEKDEVPEKVVTGAEEEPEAGGRPMTNGELDAMLPSTGYRIMEEPASGRTMSKGKKEKEKDGWCIINKSLVVSAPGAADQAWHSDGPHLNVTQTLPCHCLNLFVPLVDVDTTNGPTEFRPGSVDMTRDLKKSFLRAFLTKKLRGIHGPTLKRGDVLLFDYRVLHRGTANRSATARPILVYTFAKSYYKDNLNFPSYSVFDPKRLGKTEKEKVVEREKREKRETASEGGSVVQNKDEEEKEKEGSKNKSESGSARQARVQEEEEEVKEVAEKDKEKVDSVFEL